VFHSFRHTFKNAARRCGIPEDIHDALTGHSSGGGVGRMYGGAYPLRPLGAAMKKLRYPGLRLVDLKKYSHTV
jgi:integrase